MNKTVNSYDYLRVITIFAVVLLHTAAPLLALYQKIPDVDWIAGNFFDSIVRWCVPVFFMLSGTFLLDPKKNDTLFMFFRKRLNKILIPFISWSIIYYVYSVIMEGSDHSIELFVRRFIDNGIYYHLWFLYILIGLYLITPILKIVVEHTSKKLMAYYLVLWFIGNSVFGFLNYFFQLNIYFEIPIGDYVGYFILGYYLRTQVFSKKTTITIYILGLMGLFITFFATYIDTVQSGQFIRYYFTYLSPNTVIIAIALFLLFKNLNNSKLKFKKVIGFIDKRTFGIYLIHVLILRILENNFGISAFTFNPWLGIPFVSILAFIISCLSVYILQKIPFVKRVVS